MLIAAFAGPPCLVLRSSGHLPHSLPTPWPSHPPGLARWCGSLRLGSRCPFSYFLSRRWLVLVLAACSTRVRWHHPLRRVELVELPMESAHLHLGEDGDCGQCVLGLDIVSI